MPILGEIIKLDQRYLIWHACTICGKARWVFADNGIPRCTVCNTCAHEFRKPAISSETTPKLGDICKQKHHFYIWHACIMCGKERWVAMEHGKQRSDRCISCSLITNSGHDSNPRYPKYKNSPNPTIGDTAYGYEVGFSKAGRSRYIYHSCPNCGINYWTRTIDNKTATHNFCIKCSRKINGVIARSKRTEPNYVRVALSPDDFFISMTGKSHTLPEHRLVMAKHLKRCLLPWEIVHHKNGIKDDNRIENLELLPAVKYHVVDSNLKSRVTKLIAYVNLLEEKLHENNIPLPKGIWQKVTK